MKRFIVALLMAVLCLASCHREQMPDFNDNLAELVGTRAADPLNHTIWEYETGEMFNQYLYFEGKNVSFFYGMVEDGHIQRFSDFYTAGYEMDEGAIYTSLTYPNYKLTNYTEFMRVFIIENTCEIRSGEKVFHYTTYNYQDLDELWMFIIATPKPWGE